MLVVVNPRATTVAPRIKAQVLHALKGRHEVQAVETEGPGHATQVVRAALDDGYDLVAPLGGDGTVNEVANALAGTTVPLFPLPGGATNVVARLLDVPRGALDAAQRLLELADSLRPRPVDLGWVNGRYFVFASGIGLTATVVRQVDARPQRKARLRQWYFAWAAVGSFAGRYVRDPPRVCVEVDGRRFEGVSVVVQNADPLTFFGGRPIHVCEEARLTSGDLSVAVLTRATPSELVTLAPRLFVPRLGPVTQHGQVEARESVDALRVIRRGDDPFPLEVDGDYIGLFEEVSYSAAPRALWVLA